MSIRSTLFTAAIACAGFGVAAAEPAPAADTSSGGGGFRCVNGVGVACVGSVAILPITVNIKDVRALDNNELNVLTNSLNKISILDGDILDHNKILNDLEVGVLQDFLDKFDIDVARDGIDVCTSVLGLSLCR
jgi:hypothetical protein